MSEYSDSEPQKSRVNTWTAAEIETLFARRQTGESWDETWAAFSDRSKCALQKRYSMLKGSREKEADPKPGSGRPQRTRAPPKMFAEEFVTQELGASRSQSPHGLLSGDASPEASENDCCKKCEGGDSLRGNWIVYCTRCNDSYHQQCTWPHIPQELTDPGRNWFCAFCNPARPEEPRSKRSRPSSQSELPGHSLTKGFNESFSDLVDSFLEPGICKLQTEKEEHQTKNKELQTKIKELQREVTDLKTRRGTDKRALKVSQQKGQERENDLKNDLKEAVAEKVKAVNEKVIAVVETKKAVDETREAQHERDIFRVDSETISKKYQERENDLKKAVDEKVKDEIKKVVDEKSELRAALKEAQHQNAMCRAESEKKDKTIQEFQKLADMFKNWSH